MLKKAESFIKKNSDSSLKGEEEERISLNMKDTIVTQNSNNFATSPINRKKVAIVNSLK